MHPPGLEKRLHRSQRIAYRADISITLFVIRSGGVALRECRRGSALQAYTPLYNKDTTVLCRELSQLRLSGTTSQERNCTLRHLTSDSCAQSLEMQSFIQAHDPCVTCGDGLYRLEKGACGAVGFISENCLQCGCRCKSCRSESQDRQRK